MKNSQLRLFLLSTSEAKKDKNNNVKPQQVPTSRVQMRSTISSSKRGCRSKIHFSVNQQGSSVICLKSKDLAVNGPNKEPSKPTKVESPLLQPSTCEGEENFSVPTIEEHDLEFTGTTLGQGAFGCVKLAFWNGS